MRKVTICILLVIFLVSISSCSRDAADLVLRNGRVYTMEESMPWASAVVVTGNKITAVLENDADADAYIGEGTNEIDLNGRFVMPGFIDGHTHFSGAGALINGANLLTVSDDNGLREEMTRVVGILEGGEWISGGLWGAYEEWALGADDAGKKKSGRWEPDRSAIDDITQNNPAFLNSFDRALYLANTAALKEAGLENAPVEGMKLDGNGRPTGLIYRGSPAIGTINEARRKNPKSPKRILDENRAAFKRLRESGVVEVHDNTSDEQMQRYVQLQNNGELTARVWMRPHIPFAQEFVDKGIKMGTHPVTGEVDNFLRWGAFKAHIDGIMGNHSALFFEPYDDEPDNYGRYRNDTSEDPDFKIGDMEKLYTNIKIAYEGGFVVNVHAIGTKGTALMLDTYERLMKDIGKDLRGYRVIHNQVVRPQDFPRFKQLNVIAEVNPYHLSDDMRWMEERIGYERNKGAYAFKSFLDNGATLVFGSDWPGTSAAEYHVHPKYLLHAAVNRTTVNNTPEGGWYPEQKISMHESLKAYTINAAYATFEEDVKGSLKAGKLADIVVVDRNLMEIDSNDILNMNIDMTIVDGKIVYDRSKN